MTPNLSANDPLILLNLVIHNEKFVINPRDNYNSFNFNTAIHKAFTYALINLNK